MAAWVSQAIVMYVELIFPVICGLAEQEPLDSFKLCQVARSYSNLSISLDVCYWTIFMVYSPIVLFIVEYKQICLKLKLKIGKNILHPEYFRYLHKIRSMALIIISAVNSVIFHIFSTFIICQMENIWSKEICILYCK